MRPRPGRERRSAVDGRRILHCDMDCFYAAVHARENPVLRGRPVAVGGSPEGRGVVAAASYEARRFGVRSAMPAAKARRLCPDLVFIRPDFSLYRRESEAVLSIFREYTPIVQPVSIDEAYLDVSGNLSRFGSATAIARDIRRRVRAERHLTVSIGVGPNRLIAKIASDFDKPDGLTVVPPARVEAFLAPLPIRSLPGVGPVTERKLAMQGLRSIADVRALDVAELKALVGGFGETLFRYCRGADDRPVRLTRQRKSLSSERTYDSDLATLAAMDAELGRLAARVAAGLERRSLSAATLTVKVRYSDFRTVSRSQTVGAPLRAEADIAGWSRVLLRRTDAGKRAVRLLGVEVSGLVRGRLRQLELFRSHVGEAEKQDRAADLSKTS